MSDYIAVVPIIGVEIGFDEFCRADDGSKDNLETFMAGLDEKSKDYGGYYLGRALCEMAFPEEYSAGFAVERIEETREAVKKELKERGIEKEPEFLLVEYMA